ncbi:hypothetical protein [Janthinobacterium sp. ROICE36]|uniref:hypothetical protein n=1 Tax=Janthinobacterium sp. ROICE36 TaxID=2048670 RepID=UPI0021553347|nr:hypothetical protein [Janthinobacterium sp. ROICE36]
MAKKPQKKPTLPVKVNFLSDADQGIMELPVFVTRARERPQKKTTTKPRKHQMIANIEKAQQRVKDLEEKLKLAKALKQKVEARAKAAESKQKRAADTRRKILVGAAILAKVERGEWPKDKMLEMMSQQLTRDDDRALFDLTPTDKPAS